MLSCLKHTRAKFALWGLWLCLGMSACAQPQDPGLYVENARIRELLPGRDTTAGYFELTNNTGVGVTLIGAQSPYARAIEMHKSVVRGDSVGMQRIKQHIIQAGATASFSPGGMHLMIFGVKEMPDQFPITLTFANGEQLEVSFSKLAN